MTILRCRLFSATVFLAVLLTALPAWATDITLAAAANWSTCNGGLPPASGDNIYLNSFNHHHWDGSIGGSGLGPWIYANDFTSDHTEWDNPHDNGESYSYHQDGLIMFGYQNDVPSLNQPVVFYNKFAANFGAHANWTAEVFCAVGAFVFGSGDACIVFNNLFIQTGAGNQPINTNGQQGFYGSTIQITSNVLTLTGPGGWTTASANPTGLQVAVSGCTTATFLNGQTLTIASAAGSVQPWTGMTAAFGRLVIWVTCPTITCPPAVDRM